MSNQKLDNYNNESIRKLTDLEAVRTRVSVYAGSADREGAFTTVKEIVSNSIDEFKEGYGDKIEILYNEDGSITVRDSGRGIPMDWNESEQEYNYKLLLFTLNAGGKYDSSNYGYSIGLNGIGSGLSTMSSEYAKIQSIRDGNIYSITAKKGIPQGELSIKQNKDNLPSGTVVTWKPDTDVFDDIDFPDSWFLEYIKRQAIVNKGLRIVFSNKNDEVIEEYYENGIKDYIHELANNKNFTSGEYFETDDILGKDRADRDEYKSKFEVAYVFNNDNPAMESYHNSSYLSEGGSPHDAIKSAFVYTIDRLIKKLNKYNKNEKKISFTDIEESLVVITNTYSTETQYKNQTKLAISNKFIKDKLNELLRNNLQVFFVENPLDAEKVADQVLANKRAREKAEKTRIDVRKQLSKKNNSITNKVEGYYPPKSKNKEERILAICEGRSALSSMLDGRDINTYGIYPIRGKTLNVYKASNSKIAKDELITDLYSILGCGMELEGKRGTKSNNFDINNLQFDKITIFADADEDGVGSILPLLLVMFERLSPELLKEGKIYYGQTPKYEVKTLNEEYYAFNDKEFEEIKKEIGNQKYEVNFVKGLGELNQQGISMCMRPEAENLLQITAEKDESFDILKVFMGKRVDKRREIILDSFREED